MTDQATYEETRGQVLALLDAGDSNGAFREFRSVLSFGFQRLDGSEIQFADALAVFAKISKHFAPQDFVDLILAAANQPQDLQCLYDLGYALYEEALPGIAATVLAQADRVQPGVPGVVSEFVCALEADGNSHHAAKVLKGYPDLVQADFMFAYLLAFNSLMSGDLQSSRDVEPVLRRLISDDKNHQAMSDRIHVLWERAARIEDVCSLDHGDLRGWNYVTTGGVLAKLSPYGYPDPMNGRFAYTQSSLESCHSALKQLQAIVERTSLRPECIFALPGRDSEILAHAASKLFGLPLRNWSEQGTSDRGIIVAYDLSTVDLDESLSIHRPGQLLYSYAMQWTESAPIAPDVVTILHQVIVQPWAASMRVNPETEQMEQTDPDERAVTEIAADLLSTDSADPDEGPVADGEQTPPALANEFLAAVGDFPKSEGRRSPFDANSPVKSNRFA